MKLVLISVLAIAHAAGAFASTQVSKNSKNPLGQVIEVLKVLASHIEEDARNDGRTFSAYQTWSNGETGNARKVIAKTMQEIADYEVSGDQDKTTIESLKEDHTKLANELGSNEQELSTAKARRKKERASFEKNDEDLREAIDSLERSIVVVKKQAPQSGSSLLGVAKKLRRTLLGGAFSVSAAQRDVLNNFILMAKERESSEVLSANFLQVRSRRDEPGYGDYESGAGGVASTLQNLLVKLQAQREDGQSKEIVAKDAYEGYEEKLSEEIEGLKLSISDMEQQVSVTQQQVAGDTGRLLKAKELLQATKAHFAELLADFGFKAEAFKARGEKRSDETIAVEQARRILSSDLVKRIANKDTKKSLNFLQVTRQTRRMAHHIVQSSPTAGLTLLAVRTQLRRAASSDEPFANVLSMIRSMLKKLTDQANSELTHKEWCEGEMSKTGKELQRKEMNIQKLEDRISAMDAENATLADDIGSVTHDLEHLSEAVATANAVRKAEAAQAMTSIEEYKNMQELLQSAINALKKFYGESDTAPESIETDKNAPMQQRAVMGQEAVGILEIAIQDFADLERELAQEEKLSKEEFAQLEIKVNTQAAVFQKDLEGKTQTMVKFEGAKVRTTQDLNSYSKELKAVTSYHDELKATCVVRVDGFEERKTRREAALKSLKEALEYLENS